ncbi:hypothetical protein [Viscerimonas tarda]
MMKLKIVIVLFLVLTLNTLCHTQTKQNSKFNDVVKLFPEQKSLSKYKDGVISKINKINKEDAIKYLHLTEEDLKMNDYSYNYDEEIVYDNWVEVLPGALGKISTEKYIALVYALLKSPSEGLETYKTMLTTFTYEGQIIDSIVVRSQYTPEVDWRDVVFLESNILRIFDYKPNMENYNIKGGAYYIIDEKGQQTVVEINDYQIDENGKISHIKTHPKQYLKEFVSFYREYHKDSDDPMNEYDY